MQERQVARKIILLLFVAFLAYVAVSYLLICFYVAPPFVIIGVEEEIERSLGSIMLGWFIILFFLLLVGLSRYRFRSETRKTIVIASGFILLQAMILIYAINQLWIAWNASNEAIRKTAATEGVGTLGIGWAMMIGTVWVLIKVSWNLLAQSSVKLLNQFQKVFLLKARRTSRMRNQCKKRSDLNT